MKVIFYSELLHKEVTKEFDNVDEALAFAKEKKGILIV